MDEKRFDELTRALSAGVSRRGVVAGFAALIGGALSASRASAAKGGNSGGPKKCYGGGSLCTNGNQCCSGICTNRQCAPEGLPAECVPGESQPCYEGPAGTMNVGVCRAGMQTCDANGFWDPCMGQVVPQAEICGNGLDDDCDGAVDEDCVDPCAEIDCDDNNPCTNDSCEGGTCFNTRVFDDTPCPGGVCFQGNCVSCLPGDLESCYTGPLGTEGIGICTSGQRTCDATGQWGACINEVTPSAEICGNGLDDDCDGDIDEGCTSSCSDSVKNGSETDIDCGGSCPPCALGQACSIDADCLNGNCVGNFCAECAPGATRSCYNGPGGTAGVGECRAGTESCNSTGQWSGICSGQVLPSAEVCDGRDNDCDGQVDENVPGVGSSCNTGLPGVCSTGVFECVGGFMRCRQLVAPSQEICDGLDNDCDGLVDENPVDAGQPCEEDGESGQTICLGGQLTCLVTP